jgi:hypothetical protein
MVGGQAYLFKISKCKYLHSHAKLYYNKRIDNMKAPETYHDKSASAVTWARNLIRRGLDTLKRNKGATPPPIPKGTPWPTDYTMRGGIYVPKKGGATFTKPPKKTPKQKRKERKKWLKDHPVANYVYKNPGKAALVTLPTLYGGIALTKPGEPELSMPPLEGTDPTKPGTDPTKPGTDPTKPGTDPTKPGTDPTKPGTDPTTPTGKELAITGLGGAAAGGGLSHLYGKISDNPSLSRDLIGALLGSAAGMGGYAYHKSKQKTATQEKSAGLPAWMGSLALGKYLGGTALGAMMLDPIAQAVHGEKIEEATARNLELEKKRQAFLYNRALKRMRETTKGQIGEHLKGEATANEKSRDRQAEILKKHLDHKKAIQGGAAKRDAAHQKTIQDAAKFGGGGAIAGGGLSHLYGRLADKPDLRRDLLATLLGGAGGVAYGVYKNRAK